MTDRQITHGPGCWGWGPRHYECALREIERLAARLTAETSNARGEWVLVPREPTEAMISHGEEWEYSTISNGPAMARQLYAAMLAAAPSPAAAPQQTAVVDDAMVERACRHWYAQWDTADRATKMLWAKTMCDLLTAALASAPPSAPVDVEAVLRQFLTEDGFIAECDIQHIVAAFAAQQQGGA